MAKKQKKIEKKEHIFYEGFCIFCGKADTYENRKKGCIRPAIIKETKFDVVRILCENGYIVKFVVPVYEYRYESGKTTLVYILEKSKN